ncbi:hypothetical protein EDB82DRAFT_474671 [Fusarium venenatum]|uniref:uncharacterized protein n=1 Tax=Fusarium venenatum TaxID=56646 RepID=UPI001D5AA4CB|nr:hypothetical protein EDB82DRAFT_474671 [Fusarium venenatum]
MAPRRNKKSEVKQRSITSFFRPHPAAPVPDPEPKPESAGLRLFPIFANMLADWINAIAKLDFKVCKCRLVWDFNSVSNISIMHKIFRLGQKHVGQVKQWRSWSLDKKRAVLEALQIGTKTPTVDQELSKHSYNEIFDPGSVTNKAPNQKLLEYLKRGRDVPCCGSVRSVASPTKSLSAT